MCSSDLKPPFHMFLTRLVAGRLVCCYISLGDRPLSELEILNQSLGKMPLLNEVFLIEESRRWMAEAESLMKQGDTLSIPDALLFVRDFKTFTTWLQSILLNENCPKIGYIVASGLCSGIGIQLCSLASAGCIHLLRFVIFFIALGSLWFLRNAF